MKLYLIETNKIFITDLPKNISGNYWIADQDKDGKERNIINVITNDGTWHLHSVDDNIIIYNNSDLRDIELKENNFYKIKIAGEKDLAVLYSAPDYDSSNASYTFSMSELSIGNSSENSICYNAPFIDESSVKITLENGLYHVIDNKSKCGVYINNKRITDAFMENGDVLFIMGLKISFIGNTLVGNNPMGKVFYSSKVFSPNPPVEPLSEEEPTISGPAELYTEKDYFSRAPRFQTLIEKKDLNIDSPPGKMQPDDTPLIYTIGPMITMSMSSMVSAYVSITAITSGSQKASTAVPTLVMTLAMVCGSILWPLLTRRYSKQKQLENEKKRQEKYREYIKSKCEYVDLEMKKQRQILLENYLPIDDCEKIILMKNRKLWERKKEDKDFMAVRLGKGVVPVALDIKYPEEHFTMEEDDLKDIIGELVNKSRDLVDSPIGYSLAEKYITAIVGKWDDISDYIKGIILQLVTFQSYDDLKLVFMIDKKNEEFWEFAKRLPHTWNTEKNMRFFASNYDDMKELSVFIEREFYARSENSSNDVDYKNFNNYYLIITDNYLVVRNVAVIDKIVKQKKNLGFGLLILNENLATLPDECTTFVSIVQKSGGIFESELTAEKQKEFSVEEYEGNKIYDCVSVLANIPIKVSGEMFNLPNIYEFLEMYQVGNIEQLNVLQKWKYSNSTTSLAAPVGIDSHGMLLKLDIHEKIHGPHGLIAGTTGSGKSELIITYILSMAINYHPDDVSFVLIDYKGGGLAGAFKNDDLGIKLPHLAGTITNLDVSEINRALTSIQSELRRRQGIFNEAREKLNEGVIDIYKYQKLYHEGLVEEPLPHLVVISDEFAELKANQPDFMDQLISTARIGRSLGVHLILATQKPSGVVNDQIWSNSRFRICLKVQDKSDSTDMIKRPDAAYIKQTGRFFLQVGYDEYFELGQSAWAGSKYIPKEKFEKRQDDSVSFINNIGVIVKEVRDKVNNTGDVNHGEQLVNVVRYLSDVAKKENISVKQLWLDRIPDVIYVNKVREKYNFKPEPYIINPVVGEYDDPENQFQGLLNLPLYTGNCVVYGTSGSGRDILVNTIIYSCVSEHTSDEVNIYILDFGSESLRMFGGIPHIGDILYVGDDDKIEGLFKMLFKEINIRKNMFAEYGGSYDTFIKYSGQKLPMILVMINNFEVMGETYGDYEDTLQQLTRDGEKYGIIFILAVSATNAIRYRLAQNFKNKLVLQLNEEYGYASVINTRSKLQLPNIEGRGFVEMGGVFEFQTAYMCNPEVQSDFIHDLANELKTKNKKAPSVPILPDKVTLDFVEESIIGNHIPVGIFKESLEIASFDFYQKNVSLISTQDLQLTYGFVKSLIYEFSKLNKEVIIIDSAELFTTEDFNKNYFNGDYDNIFKKIYDMVEEQQNKYNSSGFDKSVLANEKNVSCIIAGISDFKDRLSPENQQLFDELFEKSKSLGTFSFVIVDIADQIRKFEYDSWYKNCVSNNRGIWIGNGIAEQYTIKLAKTPRNLYDTIPEDFGYLVEKGNATLIKPIDFY